MMNAKSMIECDQCSKQLGYLAPRPVASALNLAEAGLLFWFCPVAPVYGAAQKVEEHRWHLGACRFRTSCFDQQDSPVGNFTKSTRYNWSCKIQTTSYRDNTTVLWVQILVTIKGSGPPIGRAITEIFLDAKFQFHCSLLSGYLLSSPVK
jgi:hypothetical protein